MFKVQSLFEQCPKGGMLSYELSIPVDTANRDTAVSVELPEGDKKVVELQDGCVRIQRKDGPGLWRFHIKMHSPDDGEKVWDYHIIDVGILEESEEEFRNDICESVERLYHTPANKVDEEMEKLSRKHKGRDIPEIAKLFCLRDNKAVFPMLQRYLQKRELRPYLELVASAAAQKVYDDRGVDFAMYNTGLSILDNVYIKPHEKGWLYLKILSSPKISSLIESRFSPRIVDMLIKCTKQSDKAFTLHVCESLCRRYPHKVPALCKIFAAWGHKDGIKYVLPSLEGNQEYASPVCDLLKSFNYTEAAPLLREVLSCTTFEKGGKYLIETLAEWKDPEAVDVILEKLEMETNPINVGHIMRAVKKYQNPALKEKLQKIQDESPERKAQVIERHL